MSKQFIFNSSMPRSGSELLQVILHQNPDIYGSPTSPLLEYIFGARTNTQLTEVKSQNANLMKTGFLGFCKGGFQGYYDNITDRPVVCDKSRGWLYYYKWLEDILGEKPKILCCIRDLRQVITSMENIWRRNKHLPIGPDNPAEMLNITVEGRVAHWLNTQPVGLALQRLYDADVQGFLKDVHIVRYEDLTENPKDTMVKIYEYLELPYFEHDFNNVIKIVEENSTLFGPYGNHNVSPIVEPKQKTYNEVLGRQVSENIVSSNSWFFQKFYH